MTLSKSIETTIRKRRLFFAGGVARQSKDQLPRGVMPGTIDGGENPRSGGRCKAWQRCIVEDHREFRAMEGSTEVASLVLEVETALLSTGGEKAGKWYRGILEAVERFMVSRHEAEAEMNRPRRASAVDIVQGNGGGRGNRRICRKLDQRNAARAGNRKEIADRVARHQAD